MGTISNEQIFALLQRTSQDVQDIKQDVADYKKEVESLKESVEVLEAENIQLRDRLSFQEELNRRKHILVFRIAEIEGELLEKVVLNFLNKTLETSITINGIDNFYGIGQKRSGEARPISIKFTRELTVREVFKNVKRLKGSVISVSLDLTQEKREENKILYEFYKIAKEKKFSAKINKSKLIINNEEYTAEILKKLDKRSFLELIVDKQSLFRSNSAPPTPTILNKSFESSSEEAEEEKEIQTKEDTLADKKEERNETRNSQTKAKGRIKKNQKSSEQTPKRTTRSGSTSGSNQHHQSRKPTIQRK